MIGALGLQIVGVVVVVAVLAGCTAFLFAAYRLRNSVEDGGEEGTYGDWPHVPHYPWGTGDAAADGLHSNFTPFHAEEK